MLKQQLALLTKEFTTLKNKITTKLQAQSQTITQTQTKLTESQERLQQSNHQLELVSKENAENEKVLETLLKEFKELSEQLN